ncbi:unnamed protein product, partial [Allacma fusca]
MLALRGTEAGWKFWKKGYEATYKVVSNKPGYFSRFGTFLVSKLTPTIALATTWATIDRIIHGKPLEQEDIAKMAAGGSGITVLGLGIAYYFLKKRNTPPAETNSDSEPLIQLHDSPNPTTTATKTEAKTALQSQIDQLAGIK